MTDRTPGAVSASIPGHYGPAPAGVTLAEATFAAAWNIQGDPARAPFADEARRLFGLALPEIPNATERHGTLTALWLGPTSWLLVASEGSALTAFAARRDVVNGAGGALFDVTASSVGMDRRRVARRDGARQAMPARFRRSGVRRRHVRTERARARQRAFLSARSLVVHRGGRAELRTRSLADAMPIGRAVRIRRPASTRLLTRSIATRYASIFRRVALSSPRFTLLSTRRRATLLGGRVALRGISTAAAAATSSWSRASASARFLSWLR